MTASVETRTSIVWDYAPAPESADHIRLRDRYGVFIDGEFRDPATVVTCLRSTPPQSSR